MSYSLKELSYRNLKENNKKVLEDLIELHNLIGESNNLRDLSPDTLDEMGLSDLFYKNNKVYAQNGIVVELYHEGDIVYRILMENSTFLSHMMQGIIPIYEIYKAFLKDQIDYPSVELTIIDHKLELKPVEGLAKEYINERSWESDGE